MRIELFTTLTVGNLSFESAIAVLIAVANALAKVEGVTVVKSTNTATLPTSNAVGVAAGFVSMTCNPTVLPNPSVMLRVLPADSPVRTDATVNSVEPESERVSAVPALLKSNRCPLVPPSDRIEPVAEE